jgi:endonuclease/exonuclease/phosphatase family metal-dependent hydrolase
MNIKVLSSHQFSSNMIKIVLIAILFLFFLQLISDFIETIYALNLRAFSLSDSDLASLYLTSPQEATEKVMIQVVMNMLPCLFLFLPLILLFFKNRAPSVLMIMMGELMLICRIAEPLVPPQVRTLISGCGIGCFLVFFPLFLQNRKPENHRQEGLLFGTGIAFSLVLSILFRTLGYGTDISTYSCFQVIGWIMAGIAAVMIWNLRKELSVNKVVRTSSRTVITAGTGKTTGLSLGIIGIITLLYFVFSSPTVIARWTEGNYIMIVVMLLILTAIFLILIIFKPDLINHLPHLTQWAVLIWNGLFVLMLFLTITSHQTTFPSDKSAYPIFTAPTTPLQQIPLFLMLLLSPIIFIDFTLLSRELINNLPPIRKLGAGFTIASICLLLIIFAVIFTLIWDYIPAAGFLFKDNIHLVILAAGLMAVMPVLLIKWEKDLFQKQVTNNKVPLIITVTVLVIGMGTILWGILTEIRPVLQTEEVSTIKVMTYNVQAGNDSSGSWNFDGQLEVIAREQPDIIGLQESDTCRISGGNKDIVRFMANNLKYHSYFGPKTVTGTFGIALLSRYPIENPRTFYMYSKGEQTATIEAQIIIGKIPYHVLVTHLGNYGPVEQQQNILHYIKGKDHIILMGDFNFTLDTEQYAVTTAVLEDSWKTASDNKVFLNVYEKALDHIFVSPGITVTNYKHTGADNSDHPAVVVTLVLTRG